ncbi:MAG: penicillin-binding protein 2 [Acidimicrobiia bacterium]|nr:penicillin-binding protein 2 [Acidimicrobiia bacterium]
MGDMTPGVRLAALGIVFSALFVVLGLRLWTLQLTDVDGFRDQAARQQIDIDQTPAPRGDIVDRNGVVLAGTRPSLTLIVDRQLVTVEEERVLTQSLSAFLGVPSQDLLDRFEEEGSASRFDLKHDLTEDEAVFLVEHRNEFPGVIVESVPVRTYPLGDVAAQVVGYIGLPTADDLQREGVQAVDRIGRNGVELEYDDQLRGVPGTIKYQVDAKRHVIGLLGEEAPIPGSTIQLTLDSDLQSFVERSLSEGLVLARADSPSGRDCVPSPEDPTCPVRAVAVVQNVKDGSVLAMASVPGYDPAIFVDGLSEDEWAALSSGSVLTNFAIQGRYAPASTFKSVAYVMALEETVFPRNLSLTSEDAVAYHTDGEDDYECDGRLEFFNREGSPQFYTDWKPEGHGPIDIHDALHQSCDLYFWELALHVWQQSGTRGDSFDEDMLQQWAREFGFGSSSGIDLPNEFRGLIGDREWFTAQQNAATGRVRAEGPWSGGDLLNMVIGQGEVAVTPLQLANAYSAMLNGGTVWRPRVVDAVIDANGDVIQEIFPEALNSVDLDPRTVAALRADMRLVVNSGAGTARTAFVEFGDNLNSVGGKTGTAEIIKSSDPDKVVDTAWFVGATPMDDPEYVVTVVIERGGSGGRIAAPVARQILQYLVNGPDAVTPLAPGAASD